MGRVASCVFAVCCLFSLNIAMADEQAVRALLEARAKAWGEKDVSALVKNYDDNADYVSSSGERTVGKDAIEKQYRRLFDSGRYDNATSKQSIVHVNLVNPDVAVVDCEWASSGVKGADGKELPARNGRSVLVLIKKNDAWKIISLRFWLLPSETAR